MKKTVSIIFFFIALSIPSFAGDFISSFMKKCVESKHPVSNINIGKKMLEKLIPKTDDEDLKNVFRDLNSIRLITSDKKSDSKMYFKKAHELIKTDYNDYKEVISVNDKNTKMSILLKDLGNSSQDLIMVGLDENNHLTIINVSGKIDFKSIGKLSEALNSTRKDMD